MCSLSAIPAHPNLSVSVNPWGRIPPSMGLTSSSPASMRSILPRCFLPVSILKGKGAEILSIGKEILFGGMDGLAVVKMQIGKITHHIKIIEASSMLVLALFHGTNNPLWLQNGK
jgi:hypothetical protein